MTITMLIVDFSTNTIQMGKFIAGEFGILALIALLVYLFVYSRILYLSMFNNQSKISLICKIPLTCLFVWIYIRKIQIKIILIYKLLVEFIAIFKFKYFRYIIYFFLI